MRNNISKLALTVALMLAITFTFSCSGDSGGGNGDQSNISSGTEASKETSSSSKGTGKSSSSNEAEDNSSSSSLGGSSSSNGSEVVGSVKKDKISGFSQKGPFTKGSAITLSELNDKLAQTGRSFEEMITDDRGSFEIKNVELVSPYAMLKANGYYRNEVTSKISTAPINLYAIADIREKSNVNVNILTHLEYYRVQKLVEAGKSLKDAKKQAQKEILAVFGISGQFKDSEDMSIFGTSDGDAALLAISVLLQGDLTEGKFTERLADFNLGFRETGAWDNKTEKDAMADWATKANLISIRSNILGWNLSSSVPDFKKYVNIYVSSYYGLGACDTKKAGEIKETNGTKYICKDDAWALASELEIKFGLCTKEGEFKSVATTTKLDTASKSDTTYYICKDKAWVTPSKYELDVGGLGSCSTAGEIKKGNVSDIKYTCKNNVWGIATKCLESKSCQIFTDARDKQQYYYVKIGEQTWMAENMNYDTKTTGSVCYKNDLANCNQYGRLYDWETAKKVCPSSWHLPSKDEWQILVDLAGGKDDAGNKLKATSVWWDGKGSTGGTDDYGFSALPGGYSHSEADFYDIGNVSDWWTATEVDVDANKAYNWYTRNRSYNISLYNDDKSNLHSVRCVQD